MRTGGVCRPLHLWQENRRPGYVGCPLGLLPTGLLCCEHSRSSALGPGLRLSLLQGSVCRAVWRSRQNVGGPPAALCTHSLCWAHFSLHCRWLRPQGMLSALPCGPTPALWASQPGPVSSPLSAAVLRGRTLLLRTPPPPALHTGPSDGRSRR